MVPFFRRIRTITRISGITAMILIWNMSLRPPVMPSIVVESYVFPEILKPIIRYRTAEMIAAGIVVCIIARIWSIIGVPVVVEHMIVLSERGDILSPNQAPPTIAPAVIAGLTPRPVPTPIIAIPTVPSVPHEVPVITEVMQHIRKAISRKNFGLMSFSPTVRIVGTVSAAINAEIIISTARIDLKVHSGNGKRIARAPRVASSRAPRTRWAAHNGKSTGMREEKHLHTVHTH